MFYSGLFFGLVRWLVRFDVRIVLFFGMKFLCKVFVRVLKIESRDFIVILRIGVCFCFC